MSLSSALERVEEKFEELRNAAGDEDDHGSHNRRQTKLKELLAETCNVVAKDAAYPNVDPVALEKADTLLNRMVEIAFGEQYEFDFLPSFAHGDRSLVTDPERENLAGSLGAYIVLQSL